VIVPQEIFGDGKAEVFDVVDDLKLLAVDIIIVSLSYQIRSFLLVKVE
jgi:hypothetical protein